MIQADITPKPTSFGNYQIVRKIASGGMAEVYEAVRIGSENFQTQVALKCIRPELTANERFLKMFINEAHLGSQLHHPNIVQIQDFNRVEDIYYIAMEYVEGTDLAHFMQYAVSIGEPLPRPVILDLALQALAGLSYAHGARSPDGQPMNIVHRDLKPSNFLINRQGALKIADFGIAKASTNTYQTQTQDHIKGTLKYMSPEQVDGAQLTPSSDLFSFAVILFELATQRELFDAPGIAATLIKIATANIEDDLKFCDGIWAEMGEVLRKALDRDPEKRYESAGEGIKVLRTMDSPFKIDGALERYLKAHPGIFKSPETDAPETLNVPRTPLIATAANGLAAKLAEAAKAEGIPSPPPIDPEPTQSGEYGLPGDADGLPDEDAEVTPHEGHLETGQFRAEDALEALAEEAAAAQGDTTDELEETTASGSEMPPLPPRPEEPGLGPDAFAGLYDGEQDDEGAAPPDEDARSISGESLLYPAATEESVDVEADFFPSITESPAPPPEPAPAEKRASGIGVFAGLAIVILMAIVAVLTFDRLMAPKNPTILVLDSTPTGATVFVNGINIGKLTPLRVNLPEDETSATIRLELEGYATHEQDIAYKAGTVSEQLFALKALPKPKARLEVSSNPPGAKILINGEESGFITPHTWETLDADQYELSFSLDGYEVASIANLDVADGDKLQKHVELVPIPQKPRVRTPRRGTKGKGTRPPKQNPPKRNPAPVQLQGSGKVTVNTLPMDATVIVDGKTLGRVPLRNMNISAGDHNLTLKLGDIEKRHKFTVKDGDELKLVWDFRNSKWISR